MAQERLDIAPGHKLLVLGVVTSVAPRDKSKQPGSEAGIHTRDPPGAVLVDELHLTSSHEAGGGDVDHIVVEDVCAQENLTRAARELGQIQLRRRGADLLR